MRQTITAAVLTILVTAQGVGAQHVEPPAALPAALQDAAVARTAASSLPETSLSPRAVPSLDEKADDTANANLQQPQGTRRRGPSRRAIAIVTAVILVIAVITGAAGG